MTDRSKWIWKDGFEGFDLYCDFYDSFHYDGGKASLKVSADTNYALYINGVFLESGQYADYPHYKIYDELDVTEYCKKGTNHIAITVWYHGKATLCYYPGKPSLRYELCTHGKTVAVSDESTLCRVSREYESGLCKLITTQMGYSFHCDLTENDGWRDGALEGFERASVVEQELPISKRPIKKLLFGEPSDTKLIKSENNTHFLYDIGFEEVGYIAFKLRSSAKQKLTITYGEHILDGGVRRIIRDRDFSVEITVGEGESIYMNPFRRLGLRYLEVFAKEPIEPEYITVTPISYPVKTCGNLPDDDLDRRIYEVCVRTLELCMHEHYEDCPWREQALYAMDSRNQMICGYYAFGEYAFPRSCLKLMSEDRREDGLLSICYPCGNDLTIPSFSLHYIVAVSEYLQYSGDVAFVKQYAPRMKQILDAVLSNVKDGLALPFIGDDYWNFYDWVAGVDGGTPTQPDLILNCLLVLALDAYEQICKAAGLAFAYVGAADALRAKIKQEFDAGEAMLCHRKGDEDYTVLGNSLAVLCGVLGGEQAHQVCEQIVQGKARACTLSMNIWKYDALLKTDEEKYKDVILKEIRDNYQVMLNAGATTVWETLDGAKAFDNAGSLCHGWTAVPVYIFHRLGVAKKEE
jgi:hypothetical protein